MREHSPLARKAAATAMIGLIIAVIAAASAQFLGYFDNTAAVTLTADRAGLVMSPQAKVRMRGVVVGRVASIQPDHGGVSLRLEIDRAELDEIPGNVRAVIRSNTVFGAKSVDFVAPSTPAASPLAAGTHLTADHVEVEINTVYQQLVGVLAKVQPQKLNAVLSALDTALSGRGNKLGAGLADLSQTLRTVNPHLGALRADIADAATVSNTYADVAGELTRIVDDATRLGNTLRDNSGNLDALLVNATGMADTINGILAPKKSTVMTMLSDFNPTARLLGYQSPMIGCFFRATAAAAHKATGVFGLTTGYLSLNAGLLPGKEPYRFPQDLPIVGADGPPTCADGLGDPSSRVHTPFYVTDNAPQPYQPRTTPKLSADKLFQILFDPPSTLATPSGSPTRPKSGGR